MNIKTTTIILITASTLFTGCVSETISTIMPSSHNNTLSDANLNEDKTYSEQKRTELSTRADKRIQTKTDTTIDTWFEKIMKRLGLD